MRHIHFRNQARLARMASGIARAGTSGYAPLMHCSRTRIDRRTSTRRASWPAWGYLYWRFTMLSRASSHSQDVAYLGAKYAAIAGSPAPFRMR